MGFDHGSEPNGYDVLAASRVERDRTWRERGVPHIHPGQ